MLVTLLTAASSGLGSYQLAKFVATRAIKRKRSAAKAVEAYRLLKSGALYAKQIKEALADGLDDAEIAKAKEVIARAKALRDKVS